MSAVPKKAPDAACAAQSAASLACITEYYDTDKGPCREFFLAYRACKKVAYEEARAARIRARDGG